MAHMTKSHSRTEDPMQAFREQADEVVSRVKHRLAPADKWVRRFSSERPLLFLVSAFGVGYLAARLIRR